VDKNISAPIVACRGGEAILILAFLVSSDLYWQWSGYKEILTSSVVQSAVAVAFSRQPDASNQKPPFAVADRL